MSNNITYTRQIDSDAICDSSLVDEVYYNENTNDLYVDLDSSVYRYAGVPESVVNEFEVAPSAGGFYNNRIKGKFPSTDLGSWSLCEYEEVANLGGGTINFTNVQTGGIVSDTAVVPPSYSLKPFNDNGVAKVEGIEREYAVTFEVDGLNGRKTHTLKSTSVDEAVGTVLDLGKMLDLTFIVREVCIKFA